MAIPLVTINFVLTTTTGAIQEKIIALTPKLQRLAGLILAIVGGYLIHYYFA